MRLARGWDGRALALAGDDAEAAGDALTGLAADALGVGRLAASATLLARAEPFVTRAPHRVAVRRAWVAAELAMAGGEGSVAVRNAEVAVELAASTLDGAARHRAKSQVVLAAALCSAGALDRARVVAEAALELTGGLGLIPLRWALACLLVDLADGERHGSPSCATSATSVRAASSTGVERGDGLDIRRVVIVEVTSHRAGCHPARNAGDVAADDNAGGTSRRGCRRRRRR